MEVEQFPTSRAEDPAKSRTEFSHEQKLESYFAPSLLVGKSATPAWKKECFSCGWRVCLQHFRRNTAARWRCCCCCWAAIFCTPHSMVHPPSRSILYAATSLHRWEKIHIKLPSFVRDRGRFIRSELSPSFHPPSTILVLSSSSFSYLRAKTSCQENCNEKLHPAKQEASHPCEHLTPFHLRGTQQTDFETIWCTVW